MSMAEGIAAAGGASGSGAGGLRARLAALPLHHRFALAGSLVSLIGMALIASYVSRSIETGVVRNSAISSAVYMESFSRPCRRSWPRPSGSRPRPSHGCRRSWPRRRWPGG